MTTRVEVNVRTGQRVEIPLTQAELDDAAAPHPGHWSSPHVSPRSSRWPP